MERRVLVELNKSLMIISLLLLCWAVVASLASGYYWLQYTDIVNRISGVLISVNVGVDFGNETRQWFNDTKALTGMTFFGVSRNLLNVTYGTSSGYGAYVDSIYGLAAQGMTGWVWWKWNEQTLNWTNAGISCDSYVVAPDEVFLWYYESGWPPPPPP
jgi:hypothetical protein